MGLLAEESLRLLRETWPNINMLAEELYAIFQSELPLNITGPVTITNSTPGQPALSVAQPANSDQPPIAVNGFPMVDSLPTPAALPAPASPPQQGGVFLATVVSVGSDNLLCTVAGKQTTVKKPILLRVGTPARPGTLSLAYNTPDGQDRTASFDTSTENQVVVPIYLTGDLLYIAAVADGTFIDLNVDARAWATKIPTDDT